MWWFDCGQQSDAHPAQQDGVGGKGVKKNNKKWWTNLKAGITVKSKTGSIWEKLIKIIAN